MKDINEQCLEAGVMPGHLEKICNNCRHANQETIDFKEGLVACILMGAYRGLRKDKCCEVKDTHSNYMFEFYDGKNCTW